MVCICCSRRFHDHAAERPVITHQVIRRSVRHLFSPVTCKEHIVRSDIIAVFILLPVIVWSLCKVMSFKQIVVIEDLDAVHLADDDIVPLLIANGQVIRVVVLILDRNCRIRAIYLAYEETVVSPADIDIPIFHPCRRIDILPCMGSVRRINISDKRLANIFERACR